MRRVIDPATLVDVKRRLEAAPRGARVELMQHFSSLLGLTPQGLRAKLRRELDAGTTRQRKLRQDAGQSAITPRDLEIVAQHIASGSRENGQIGGDLEESLLLASAHLSEGCRGLSLNTWRAALNRHQFAKRQLLADKERHTVVSHGPNEMHIIDATVSWRYYWRPRGGGVGCRDLRMEDPKNKIENAEKIAADKNKLILYTLTDHTSGFIWARYGVSKGENAEGVLELLYDAWRLKEDPRRCPFHGAPYKYLYSDKGAANMCAMVGSVCTELHIRHIPHGTGNAPAGGQVEKAHHIIISKFERLLRHMDDPETLEDLNRMLSRWLIWFNGSKEHSRHGNTRTAHWAAHIKPEHLRLIPEDRKDFMALAYSYPEQATLGSSRIFKAFKGQQWALPAEIDWAKGTKVLVRRMAFKPDQVRVVHRDTRVETVATLISKDVHGFPIEAPSRSEVGKAVPALTTTPAERIRQVSSFKQLIEQYGRWNGMDALVSQVDPLAFRTVEGTPIKRPEDLAPSLIPLFDAKVALSTDLGRPLTDEEAAALEAHAENGCIDERILPAVLDGRTTPTRQMAVS